MIDWLDVIGATNIVASLASGYFGMDFLYYKPKMRRAARTQTNDSLYANTHTRPLAEAQISSGLATPNEAREYQLPLPFETHGTLRTYSKGCRCEQCTKALQRHGIADLANSSALETGVYAWGGEVIGVIQRTIGSTTITYPQNDPGLFVKRPGIEAIAGRTDPVTGAYQELLRDQTGAQAWVQYEDKKLQP